MDWFCIGRNKGGETSLLLVHEQPVVSKAVCMLTQWFFHWSTKATEERPYRGNRNGTKSGSSKQPKQKQQRCETEARLAAFVCNNDDTQTLTLDEIIWSRRDFLLLLGRQNEERWWRRHAVHAYLMHACEKTCQSNHARCCYVHLRSLA